MLVPANVPLVYIPVLIIPNKNVKRENLDNLAICNIDKFIAHSFNVTIYRLEISTLGWACNKATSYSMNEVGNHMWLGESAGESAGETKVSTALIHNNANYWLEVVSWALNLSPLYNKHTADLHK